MSAVLIAEVYVEVGGGRAGGEARNSSVHDKHAGGIAKELGYICAKSQCFDQRHSKTDQGSVMFRI